MGLRAERPGHVLDRVADLERRELGRAGADRLDHEGDRAASGSLSAIVSGIRSAPGPCGR